MFAVYTAEHPRLGRKGLVQAENWREGTVTAVPLETRRDSGETAPFKGYRGATFIRAQLQVIGEYTPGSRLTVFIEDTLDGSHWNVIGEFPDMDSAGVELLDITQPFTDTLRVRWELDGSGAPSFNFGVVWYAE